MKIIEALIIIIKAEADICVLIEKDRYTCQRF